MKYALISVYNKKGIINLAKNLHSLGWKIIATVGTFKVLKKAGIKPIPLEKITGQTEIFDGRMKTISFNIESGILFRRDNPQDIEAIKKLKILPLDLVVCNLYPFKKTINKPKTKLEEAIEMIDIGGPTMIRSAAKNYKSVTVIIDPRDYPKVINELKNKKEVTLKTREKLAYKVFKLMADYENIIENYLAQKFLEINNLSLNFRRGKTLRYGENPHQSALFYQENTSDLLGINKFKKIGSKELSYNNYLDIDGALEALSRLGGKNPACVIVKHTNPCGAAIRGNIKKSYDDAWLGDPLAAFGGIIALNRPINEKLAQKICEKFFEILIAPAINDKAKKILTTKKNLRILINPHLINPHLPNSVNKQPECEFKSIRGGILRQEKNLKVIKSSDLKVATKISPTSGQIKDLLFAWKITECSKSNAIVLAKNQMLIGSGVGQQDRKNSCELAVKKAGKRAKGAVAASDAFFPFSDGPAILIKAGIKAIIQPGGSIRDQETIDLCNKKRVAMVFTGVRCFRH